MGELVKLVMNNGIAVIGLICLAIWLKRLLNEVFGVVLGLAKDNAKVPQFPESVISTMELDAKIMSVLHQVREDFEACRVYVFSYHNGGKNLIGLDFAKVSCTHEVVGRGVQPNQRWLQNMPVTLFHAFSRLILTGAGVVCPDVAACFKEHDSSTYETLRAQCIKSCYCFGLMSDGGLPIGYLGVDYVREARALTDAELERLRVATERVAALFCLAGHVACVGDDARLERV
jgi:hypothetical protein